MVRVEHIGLATLYLGDCMDVMPTLPKVDAVITDPPYGINYKTNHRKVMDTPEVLVNDDCAPVESIAVMQGLILDGGAIYLATRFDVSFLWVNAIKDAGFNLKTPIFWDKGNHTAGDLEGDYGGQVEIFLYATKGRHILRGHRQANLWRHHRPPAGDHPTPKPVDLMKRMVVASSNVGQTILDPFMGSGTTGVACVEMSRNFIGIEKEPKYFDICCKRIETAQKQLKLL